MALAFVVKPTATIKAQKNNDTSYISLQGVTAGNITPDEAATQMNKLLAIVNWDVVANKNMTRTIKQGVE